MSLDGIQNYFSVSAINFLVKCFVICKAVRESKLKDDVELSFFFFFLFYFILSQVPWAIFNFQKKCVYSLSKEE